MKKTLRWTVLFALFLIAGLLAAGQTVYFKIRAVYYVSRDDPSLNMYGAFTSPVSATPYAP